MDDGDTLKSFKQSLDLPLDLASDADGSIGLAFGVRTKDDPYDDRLTFVIGKDGVIDKVLTGKDALLAAPSIDACSIDHAPGHTPSSHPTSL